LPHALWGKPTQNNPRGTIGLWVRLVAYGILYVNAGQTATPDAVPATLCSPAVVASSASSLRTSKSLWPVMPLNRPVEAVLRAHPLRGLVQELCGRGQSDELRLELLPAEDVTAYAAGRLEGAVSPALALLLHERTDGNGLFMVNLVEHLVQQQLVVWQEGQWTLRPDAEGVGLPEGLRQLLLRRIEALPVATRRLLETANVVGEAFTAAAVAAKAQCRVEDVEAVCDALVTQQHLLDEIGLAAWPDGSRSGSYRFQHALYQQVLYEQLGTARRMQLHQRIRVRLEAGYGARAGEVAALLPAGQGVRAARGVGPESVVAAARELLAPTYDWFTEGFATPDLREAKELEWSKYSNAAIHLKKSGHIRRKRST